MKRTFIFILALGCVVQAFSQGNAVISGRVVEQSTKNPVPFANVALSLGESDKMLTGTIIGDDGWFVIKGIAEGSYTLSISFIGYEPETLPVLVGKLNETFDVGKIELQESSKNIDEVTIYAKREIVSSGLDKKSFDIENNISQAGGSAMDAMRNLPGVTIDPEGKVLLRGSDKVTVLIDGKQSSLTGFGNQKGLENIPASNIERIEIINNPSAKYDSKGLAGIINIVYKKESEKGFNGDFGLNVGVGELTNSYVKLPYQTDFQLSAVYYAPNIIPQGKIKKRFSLDFGLKKQALKGKAEISLSATDLLNTFAIRKSIQGDGFNLTAYNYYETQVITLGMKYKF